jgi:hypothetical protein
VEKRGFHSTDFLDISYWGILSQYAQKVQGYEQVIVCPGNLRFLKIEKLLL